MSESACLEGPWLPCVFCLRACWLLCFRGTKGCCILRSLVQPWTMGCHCVSAPLQGVGWMWGAEIFPFSSSFVCWGHTLWYSGLSLALTWGHHWRGLGDHIMDCAAAFLWKLCLLSCALSPSAGPLHSLKWSLLLCT